MNKVLLAISSIWLAVTGCGYADASTVGERPYWPAYETVIVPDGCIRWNWQQGSFYNYCPRIRGPVLRVRG
jgi:hypothetical protein